MRSKRAWRHLGVLLLTGAMVLAACGDDGGGSGNSSGSKDPGYAGQLVVASTEGKTLDPARVPSESGGDLDRPGALFGTLLIWRTDGSYDGNLAESMKSDDGVTWTIKLRPDIKFTDDTPYDAEAVIFNLERQRDPKNAFGGAGNLADIASMKAVDAQTVEIVLKNPNGTFWEGFTSYNGMIGSPTAIKADPDGFGNKPIGAGPYVLTEFVRDSHTVMERNPDWKGATQPAYQTLRFQMYPDPLTRAEAFKAGEVQVGYAAGSAVFNQLGDPAASKLKIRAADGATFVLLNHSRGPAQDVRVREAVSLAFERERVRDVVLGGNWDLKLPCPPFGANDPKCVTGLWPEPNPTKAKQLIAAYAAEGKSVKATLISAPNSQAEAEFIQQTLNGIGMNIELKVMPGAEWLPAVNSGDFDMSWYAQAAPVAPRLFYHFRSDQRNIIKAKIPAFDDAILRARTSLDPAEQQKAWKEVQEILAKEFLVAYYAPFRDGYIYSDKLDLGDQTPTIWLQLSEVRPA